MSCKEFEIDILVYSELSSEEKKTLDEHLKNCSQCMVLFQEAQRMHRALKLVADQENIPRNAAKLTSDVMRRIGQHSLRIEPTIVASFFQNRLVKFALATVSSILLVTFLLELNDASQNKLGSNAIPPGAVILNIRSFHEGIAKRRSKTRLFAECRSPFKSNQYFIDCAKSKIK